MLASRGRVKKSHRSSQFHPYTKKINSHTLSTPPLPQCLFDYSQLKIREGLTMTTTQNGALTHTTSKDFVVDLFFKGMVRGSESESIENMMVLAWKQNPHNTIRTILNARDRIDGKGEKEIAYDAMLWLAKNKPFTYVGNLTNLVRFGCFKDLLKLAAFRKKLDSFNWHPVLNDIELQIYAEALKYDQSLLKTENNNNSISMAGKWAPSEKKSFDRCLGFAVKLAYLIQNKSPPIKPNKNDKFFKNTMKSYRILCKQLREKLNVVERLFCANKWDEIDLNKLPSRATLMSMNAIERHAPNKVKEWLKNLSDARKEPQMDKPVSNMAKINTKTMLPHEIIEPFLHDFKVVKQKEMLEEAWNDKISQLKQHGTIKPALAIVDVSGSMSGTPLEVAVALGLVIAEVSPSPWNNRFITFSSNPKWHNIVGTNIMEKVRNICSAHWEMSTNLMAAFELILNSAKAFNITEENMPSTIFIFSDMQFDEAIDKNNVSITNFEAMKLKFKDAGYKLPTVVFWNLNGEICHDVPVQKNENGTVLLSGYSAELVRHFMAGESMENITPAVMIEKIISPYPAFVEDSEI